MTYCVKGCSNQSRLNKNASYHKVLREEIKFLQRRLNLIEEQSRSYQKKFHEKSDKKQNIYLHNSIKISGNFAICDGPKQIYPMKFKKCSKKRYSTIFQIIQLRKSVIILIQEQYFTLLEWFLLTVSKKYILTRSTNLRSRNHSN